MSERKELGSISYHSDDDTGMYHIGEIDGGFNGNLKHYLESFGTKGRDELLTQFGYMSYLVQKTYLEVNAESSQANERGFDAVKSAS